MSTDDKHPPIVDRQRANANTWLMHRANTRPLILDRVVALGCCMDPWEFIPRPTSRKHRSITKQYRRQTGAWIMHPRSGRPAIAGWIIQLGAREYRHSSIGIPTNN